MLGTSHYVSPIIKGGRGIRRFWFCNTPFSFIFSLLEVNDHRMSMITTTDLSLRSPWKPCDPRRSSNPNSPLHPGRGMMTVCSGLNMNKYILLFAISPEGAKQGDAFTPWQRFPLLEYTYVRCLPYSERLLETFFAPCWGLQSWGIPEIGLYILVLMLQNPHSRARYTYPLPPW